MTLSGARLLESAFIGPDVLKQLYKFFADDLALGSSARWEARSRSRSSGGSTPDDESGPDPEKKLGVEDWKLFDTQPVDPLEDEPKDWRTMVDLQGYSNLEFLLAVHRHRFALLERNQDTGLYHISLTCTPEFLDEEAEITCAIAFGLGTNRKTERLDCICIAVGSTKGQVAFYTEKGALLFVERFASTAILDVSFEQFTDEQQVAVSTEYEIFSIQPFALLSTLARAKSQIAKGENTWAELSSTLELDVERIEPEGGGPFGSVIITGTQKQMAFDRYVTAACHGYDRQSHRPKLPNYSTFFVTRPDKHLGDFIWHEQGARGNLITAAVSEVASKMIPHFGIRKFFGWNTDESKKTWASGRPKITAYARGVLGEARVAEWLVRAPDAPLLAVVDNHARILLIDYKQRQVLRIWKGYRDARCLFVTAKEENRSALFLVIHAPRRDLLEIWSPAGFRVSARHVPSGSILLDGGGDMVLGSGSTDLSASAFLSLPDGRFLVVDVPFISAFVKTASQEDHDNLYLSKLSTDAYNDGTRCARTFSELRTTKGRHELLMSMIMAATSAEGLANACRLISEDEAAASVQELLDTISTLAKCYQDLAVPPSPVPSISKEKFKKRLQITEETFQFLAHLLDFQGSANYDEYLGFDDFIAMIDFKSKSTALRDKKLPDKDAVRLSRLLFRAFIHGSRGFAEQLEILKKLPFEEEDYLWLLLLHWVYATKPPTARETLCFLIMIEHFSKGSNEMLEKRLAECENMDRAMPLYLIFNLVRIRKDGEAPETDISCFEESDDNGKASPVNEINLHHGEADAELYNDTDAEPPIELELDELDITAGSSDWEAMHLHMEMLDCWLRIGHVMELLRRIGLEKQSFGRLLTNGIGYISEEISRYVITNKVEAAALPDLLAGRSGEHAKDFAELAVNVPESLGEDRIRCEAAWESVSIWARRKEDVNYLKMFTDYLSAITNERLRHGICRLAWDTHLGLIFRELAQLVDKTGRAPKDREARKNLGLPDVYVKQFIEACIVCLREMLSSVRDEPPVCAIEHEDWLKAAFTSSPFKYFQFTKRSSLADAAAKQSLVNYHLVLHHLHLAMALTLQVEVTTERCHLIRHLFCNIGQRAFFLPLTSHPLIPLADVDDVIAERRCLWIEKASEEFDLDHIKVARELCAEWNLGPDDAIVGLVTRLLRNGEDEEASKKITSLVHTERISEKVTHLLAARVMKFTDALEKTLNLSTENRLRTLAGEERDRVQWQSEDADGWQQSIVSLGRIAAAIRLNETADRQLRDISSVCLNHFGIRFW
ncbi:unnamed protein product, partial [Mesorhabditis spiculigera]